MRLTGPEFTTLEEALRESHVDYDDLGLTLRRSGYRIQDITGPGPMPNVVTSVITYAETRDWVQDLVAAARASNPSNEKLLMVSAAIGLEPGGTQVEGLPEEQALAQVSVSLERIVDSDRGIADLGSFAAKLLELMRQVCAVELDDTKGTGFLIGPGTVLTNYHVVEKAIKGEVDPRTVRLRFDYRRLRDGLTTIAGVTYELADDWLVDAKAYSPADLIPYDEASLPADDQLDYAVLRTREKVGLAAPSGPVDDQRGWVVPRTSAYAFPVDSFLMIVQHPCHDPISFDSADDAVLRVNPNGTRVHYRTNTMPGSSGSPVLSRELELVGLHHTGEPGGPDSLLPCHKQVTPATYNEGIPIAKIQAQLAAKGLSWVFGSEAP